MHELIQYLLPQSFVLRQPLSGSRLPSSPRLREGFRIPFHQRIEERIVFREDDRSRVGPMFEEFLVIPQQSIQVRHPKIADPAPKGDEGRRRDHVDWVPLAEAQAATHGTVNL